MTKTTKASKPEPSIDGIDVDDINVGDISAEAAKPAVKSLFDLYETDVTEEEEGRWFVDVAPGADFKIRRFTAKAVQNHRTKLQQAFSKYADKKGVFPDHIAERIVNEQMSVVVVGWRGPAITDREGNPLEYSPEAVKTLLKQLPNLQLQLLMISMDMANFRTEERKELEGN